MKIRKIPPAPGYRPYPLLVRSILAYSLVLEPENEIVYRDKVRYNYIELNRRVRKLANVLAGLGLEGGETIGVMDYDSHRYLECYFAIPMTGNVLHTVNWRLSPAQILYTINHAEDTVLFVHEDFLPILEKFAGEMPTVRKIVVLREDVTSVQKDDQTAQKNEDAAGKNGKEERKEDEYETLLAGASDEYAFPEFDENAVATTFYTTGTVGEPKGVFFTHRQLVLHTLSVANTFGFVNSKACRLHSGDVYMPLTPMFHVHAWGIPYLATMYSLKQVYAGKLEPTMLSQLIAREKPSFSHCVPTVLQIVLKCAEAASLDLSGWKVIIGGAALPPSLAKAALARGIDVITGYGMSETCPVIAVAYLRPEDMDKGQDWQIDARVRTGVPVPLVEMKLIMEDGRPAAGNDKEAGELLLHAPWLTQGYVNDPEKGALLWEGGFLHTGDVATVDANHSLKISDRIKDLIKSGGEWISSLDLENKISLHSAVAETAVVGMPDATWGERPYALIVLKPGIETTKDNIKEHLKQYIRQGLISKWAMPEQIEFVEAIPKTSVGKIDKKKIRANYIASA